MFMVVGFEAFWTGFGKCFKRRKVPHMQLVRFLAALAAFLVCLSFALLAARAASQSPTCLVIDTHLITELLDPQTFSIHTFKFPSIKTNDPSNYLDYAY